MVSLRGLGHLVAQVALMFGETLLWSKISNNMVHYYIQIKNNFMTQFRRFQIEDAQCFPVEKGPGETVLMGPIVMALLEIPFSIASLARRTSIRFLG